MSADGSYQLTGEERLVLQRALQIICSGSGDGDRGNGLAGDNLAAGGDGVAGAREGAAARATSRSTSRGSRSALSMRSSAGGHGGDLGGPVQVAGEGRPRASALRASATVSSRQQQGGAGEC